MFKRIPVISFIVVFLFFSCSHGEPSSSNDLENDDSTDDGTIVETDLSTEDDETEKTDEVENEDEMKDIDNEENDFSKEDDDVEIPDEKDCPECLIVEEIKCSPSSDPCSEKTVDTALYASFRKDFYYPNYQEGDVTNPIPAPVNGGRFNTTGVAEKGGKVTAVYIDGVNVADLLTQKKLDWYHVYPLTFVEGNAFWVNFHSRESSWNTATGGTLKVETEEGVAFEGTFDVKINQIPLKYVGFADDYKTAVIHFENRHFEPVTVSKILFNGRDVTDSVCLADKTVNPFETKLVTLELCEAAKPGDPWTVTVLTDKLSPSTAGGRVIRNFYPILTWQTDSDCPYSPYNTSLYENHKSRGFDTFFTRPSHAQMCHDKFGKGTNDIFELLGPVSIADNIHHIFTIEHPSHYLDFPDVSRIAAALHADECDDSLLDNDYPKPQTRAEYAKKTWEKWPEMPTYIGGSRGRYNGSFAGATDIQGFDYYVAACAPHITVAGTHPPLRGAFDQLYLVYENHMPHTTWAYTQGLHSGWNATIPVIGTEVYRQPNPAEYRLQTLNVAMVGSKGLMYFQTNEELIDKYSDTWTEMGNLNRDFHGLKPYLLEGTVNKIIDVPDSHVVSILWARKMITAVIMNLKVKTAPTEAACLAGQDVHWILDSNIVSFDVEVPEDFRVFEILELRSGQFFTPNYSINGRTVTFQNIGLGHNDAGRIFVLNSDADVKTDMLSRMSY
ncbi:MAG TPA: hypothetical protein VLJ60_10955 [bacterium]|nr:hypothetical protein [bacterium]